MKLNKKLGLVAAALLAVSPVVTTVAPTQPVLAAKKKSAVNANVKRNIKLVKKIGDLSNLNIVDSSQNLIKFDHLRIYRNAPKVKYIKSGDGKNGQGEYRFSQGLKGVGFAKLDVARDYSIELPIKGVGGDIIGRFEVPANATTATGYISFRTKTNDTGDKFNIPFMGLPVSYVEPKKAKKVKKNKKTTKRVKKSKKSKKAVHKTKRARR